MWWWALDLARAGAPVRLPAGEQPADWQGALALGGFEWGGPDADVVVDDRGATWVVTVRDPSGAARTATVAPPRTADAREDLVWLLVSLSTAVEAPPAVVPDPEPLPAPIPRPAPRPTSAPSGLAGTSVAARPAPAPIGDLPPVPAPVPPPPPPPIPARPPPAPVAPPAVAVAPPVARPPAPEPAPKPPKPPKPARPPPHLPQPASDPGLRPWVRASTGAMFREGGDPRAVGVLSAGVARDRLAVGLSASLGTRSALPDVGAGRSWSGTELAVEGWAGPRWVRAGAAAGAEVRRFFDGDTRVAAGAMPFVRGELAAELYVGARLWLEAGVAARLDLGVTELRVAGLHAGDLASTAVEPAVAVRWR
jgi:hypothetical protein